MSVRSLLVLSGLILSLTNDARTGQAQQVYGSTPLVGASDSFYESFGIDWGFSRRWRNGYMFFNRGGANTSVPPFGGYNPNSDARFGWGTRGNNGSAYFNLHAGQGSNRTITSAAPSLMFSNGAVGSFQNVSVRPFVTGLVPVVGDMAVSPVEERLERLREQAAAQTPGAPAPSDAELLLGSATRQDGDRAALPSSAMKSTRSSAERGDISLAEIRRQQKELAPPDAAAELERLIQTAQLAEASGRWGAARIRYRQAADKASGELRQELLSKLDRLKDE